MLEDVADRHKKEIEKSKEEHLLDVKTLNLNFANEKKNFKTQLTHTEYDHKTEISGYQTKRAELEREKTYLSSKLSHVQQEQQALGVLH